VDEVIVIVNDCDDACADNQSSNQSIKVPYIIKPHTSKEKPHPSTTTAGSKAANPVRTSRVG